MPGPETPPFFAAKIGIRLRKSIAMPGPTVLMAQKPSTPASAQAVAITSIFATFGVSLAKTGMSFASFFTALMISDASEGSSEKSFPRSFQNVGVERFTSMISGLRAATSCVIQANSSGLRPITFAIKGTGLSFKKSLISCFAFSGPASGTPTAFRLQCSVEMIVGLRLPWWGTGQRDLVVIAPAPLRAMSRQLLAVMPMIPDARTVGFEKGTPRIVWERFTDTQSNGYGEIIENAV